MGYPYGKNIKRHQSSPITRKKKQVTFVTYLSSWSLSPALKSKRARNKRSLLFVTMPNLPVAASLKYQTPSIQPITYANATGIPYTYIIRYTIVHVLHGSTPHARPFISSSLHPCTSPAPLIIPTPIKSKHSSGAFTLRAAYLFHWW